MRYSFLVLLLIIIISGCTSGSTATLDNTTLEEQYGDLLDDIDYITIRSGNGDLFEIKETNIVKQWVQDVSTLPLPIDNETEGAVGTLFVVKLYSGNELKVNFSTDHVNDYLLKPNSDLVNAIKYLLPSTEIQSITVTCTEVCHTFMNNPFPELIFEDINEIKVFEDAISYGIIDTREVEYAPLFNMNVTFNDESQKEYKLHVADDVNIKTGLLLSSGGQAYVIPEEITNELKLLIYKD